MTELAFRGTGRRKTAVARVRIWPGTGRITVNGKPLEQYFPDPTMRMSVLGPLVAVESVDKFDIAATVSGGGVSGQAGAVRHGIARSLVLMDVEMRPPLKKLGFLTRDSRMKERRKYGLKKARKAPQFSKR